MSDKRPGSKAFPYVDRDVSWLHFNHRILLEAQRSDVPLLERFNFLGIYSNNLDEFFRVRVASRQHVAAYKKKGSRIEREKARRVLRKIFEIVDEYAAEFEVTFNGIVEELEQDGVYFVNEKQLTSSQEREVISFYINKLNGNTNPIFLKRMKFLAEELDEALYLAVDLRIINSIGKTTSKDVALVRVPSEKFGRFVRLSDQDGKVFIMFLDDVIRFCMPYIFLGLKYNHFDAYSFKFTKNAEMDPEGDIHTGVIQKVSHGLKNRRHGEMLRLVFDKEMPLHIEQQLVDFAEIDKYDAKMRGSRYHNSKDLMSFPDLGRKAYRYTPKPPLMGYNIDFSESVIDRVLAKDIGLHFPYRSFDRFLRLLREAAIRDDVREIKVSLYRVAKHSNVIEALMAAAANGKKVTAVVELMARFDEASNISWSRKMEAAGIRVVFGPEKLKVHGKLASICTSKGNIACVGTGNMHEGTAKIYTDYMLLTARPGIVREVLKVFDFIERPFVAYRFRELLVSPSNMRNKIIALINKEIKYAEAGLPAFIKVKINHLTDERIIARLYAAGRAGVEVKLLVRGNCCLVPQVKGVSPGIVQHAIIDCFLEHSRIFIFGNAGAPKFYIGSADWMERNLDRRIEVTVPVYDEDLKTELMHIVDYGLQDVSQSHYVNYHGLIPLRYDAEPPWFRSQEELYKYYLKQEFEAEV